MLLPILQQELEQRLSEFRGDVGAVAAGAAVVDLTGVVALATEGVTQIGSDTPVAETDAWHIGSCTKMFTALTMATLIEDGRLDWGTTLANVFTDVGSVDSSWRRVTIEDLLQCRAGIRANIPISEMGAAHRCEDQLSDQRTTLAQSVLAAPSHNPGRFVYSNVGYILAGAAIDRLAEVPYENALAQRVMSPAGITDFGFGAPPRISGHRRAFQFGPIGVGGLIALDPDEPANDNPALYTPAGRLHLPLEQWAKVIGLFFGENEEVVSLDSLRRIATSPSGGHFAMGWGAHPLGGLGMQGSNTLSCATVRLVGQYAALVVVSDARPKVLRGSATLADQMVAAAHER